MSAGWTTLVVASVLLALAMVIWNVFLMALLEIAKADVRRLQARRGSGRSVDLDELLLGGADA